MGSRGGTVNLVNIPLSDAVERFRQEQGAPQNAYDWYRRSATRYGSVAFGKHRIPAVKRGREWTVAEADLVAALDIHRGKRADLVQMAAQYEAHVLNEGTVKTVGGGYTVNGDFHFLWDDTARAHKQSEGFWRCNSCWTPAQVVRGKEECHRCRDWSPCGRDCTASGLQCSTCGTAQTF